MKPYRTISPQSKYLDVPCGIVSLGTAFELFGKTEQLELKTRDDGYATLREMSSRVKEHFHGLYRYYKRDERPYLRELDGTGIAIVCVLGHFVTVDFDNGYVYSFFNNFNDKVVAVWRLREVIA